MTKWELARYLIDAKKCVDSIMYIDENLAALRNIGVREKVDSKRRELYINCCVILDKVFPKKKKELCSTDTVVQRFYYERDKNFAHKDSDYKPAEYASLSEMSTELQNQLIHLRELCKKALPDVITLDFVPHDRELFRFVNGLTAEQEAEVEERKYPLRKNYSGEQQGGRTFQILHDTEDIRSIDEADIKNYATLIENGINNYEGLQNRQDSCIRTNVLFGLDMWCTINRDVVEELEELRKIGVIDKYNVPNFEALSDPIIQNRFAKIIEAAEKRKK